MRRAAEAAAAGMVGPGAPDPTDSTAIEFFSRRLSRLVDKDQRSRSNHVSSKGEHSRIGSSLGAPCSRHVNISPRRASEGASYFPK